MDIDLHDAVTRSWKNKDCASFPELGDPRRSEGSIFPAFSPRFPLDFNEGRTIFTIGSCFARNIEEALQNNGVTLPTMAFSVPKSEWFARPNGLLNEYTPGTMAQRILYALDGRAFPESTIVPTDKGHADTLLPGGEDVALERAISRRAEIDAVYAKLKVADAVIITLGFVESWFDLDAGIYLNRMPPWYFGRKHPRRYLFRQLNVDQCYELLEPAFAALTDTGKNIVLTVSPVPIQRTFTAVDCVTANEYSKSVLRVTADKLVRRFSGVDYFPSYEIVRSGALANFETDGIHVKDAVVRKIVSGMIESYRRAAVTA